MLLQCFSGLKNPDGSHLWRQRRYQKYKDPTSKHIGRFDMCRFGTSWRKRTRIASNIPGILQSQNVLHLQEGKIPYSVTWSTSYAERNLGPV